MAKQARIVDFEEARSSSSSRASSSRPRTSSSKRGSATKGRSNAASGAASSRSSGKRSAKSNTSKNATRSSRSTSSRAGGKSNTKRATGRSQSSKTRTSSGKNTSASKAKASKFEQVKRDLAKKKTSRLFAEQVEPSAPSGDEPRAALYKGKMGSTHKKSTKMQAKGGQSFLSGLGLPVSLPKINAKLGVVLIACACLLFSCLFLYGPVKNYYVAVRDQARAEVAYEVVSTRSKALKEDVAALVTDEGVEDRVREQYGWVKQGENAVMVSGLSEGDPTPAEVLRTTTLNDIHAPETWYSPVLDKVFGYEG